MVMAREIVLVTGGTGTLGRAIMARLAAGHHRTRLLVHSGGRRPTLAATSRVEIASGDLGSGAGLRDAVAGVGVIIHAATSAVGPTGVDVEGTRRLLAVAREVTPAPHVVYISIVGVERSAFPYYVAKRAAETLVTQAGLPWSILRATQFHDFARDIIQSLGADSAAAAAEVVVPAGVRLQSIDTEEVADRLVALAELGPLGHSAALGGPEILTIEAMTRAYLEAHGRTVTVRSEALAGDLYDAFRSGRQLTPDHAYGVLTWGEYLRRASPHERRPRRG